MDSLLKEYRNLGRGHELEIRFENITSESWKLLYSKMIEAKLSYAIKQIISVIQNNNYIKNSFYNGVTKIERKEEFMEKTRLNSIKSSDYKIVLSREKPIPKFTINTDNSVLIRMKNRHSFNYKNWSLDFTLTRTFNNNTFKHSCIEEFFGKTSFTLINMQNVAYEIEAEYKGEPQLIHINEITDVLSLFVNTVQDTTTVFPKAIPLTKQLYLREIMQNQDLYYLTTKSDGISAIVTINNEQTKISTETFTKVINIKSEFEIIFLGEYINDTQIFILDVGKFDKHLSNYIFVDRYNYVKQIIELSPIFQEKKQYLLITDFPNIYDKLYKLQNQDGIIFNKNTQLRNMVYYKWKPANKLTIEFIIKKSDKPNEYHLYSMITKFLKNAYKIEYFSYFKPDDTETYIPVPFMPFLDKDVYKYISKDNIKDNSVGEFLYIKNVGWKLIRIRDDRIKGNDFRIAEQLFMQSLNPFTIDFLKNPITDDFYFKFEASDHTKNQRKFVTFVRGILSFDASYGDNLAIFAAGRGAELFISNSVVGVKKIVHIDVNINALEELISRMYFLHDPLYYSKKKVPESFAYNYVIDINLLDNYSGIINKIVSKSSVTKFNTIIMNLAIHYITIDQEHLKNLVLLISNLSEIGTTFIWTGFDGKPLFDKLKDVSELNYEVNNKIIYQIKKKYTATKLDFGLPIDVMLPFSNEFVEESLIDYSKIVEEFEKVGFELRQYGCINNFLKHYTLKLDPVDIEYNSNIYYASVCKVK